MVTIQDDTVELSFMQLNEFCALTSPNVTCEGCRQWNSTESRKTLTLEQKRMQDTLFSAYAHCAAHAELGSHRPTDQHSCDCYFLYKKPTNVSTKEEGGFLDIICRMRP